MAMRLCEKAGKQLGIRQLLKGDKKIVWNQSLANEFGRLMNGIGDQMPKGTNTIFPILKKHTRGTKSYLCQSRG